MTAGRSGRAKYQLCLYLRLPFNVGSFNGNINLLSPLQGLKNLIEELGAIFISLFQNGKYKIILLGEEPSIHTLISTYFQLKSFPLIFSAGTLTCLQFFDMSLKFRGVPLYN